MNILYIDHYAGSPEMGMEFRPYYLAREWVKLGHRVFIIAGDYSHLRKSNPSVTQDMQQEVIDGIVYYWLKTGTYEGNGVSRALTMLRFCRKLRKWKSWIRKEIRPDVVISSSTYPIDSIPTHSIAKKGAGKGAGKAKHIHEVHDMWPSTLIEIGGMSRKNPFVMMMQYGENYAYRHADAVVSLPKYAKDYMMEHGLKEQNFFSVPNGIVTEEWDQPEPLPEEHRKALEQIKADGKFIAGYFGGHALSNCLSTFVEAARSMQDEPIHFVLVGDGVQKEELIRSAEDLSNITFLPPINKKAIPSLTAYFDCTYIGAMDSPLYRFGACMNKMFDGMMAGSPMVFAINAPPTPVTECSCGLIVPPEDIGAITDALRKLMAMPAEERAAMGMRGRQEVLEHYTYERLAQDFLDVMCSK